MSTDGFRAQVPELRSLASRLSLISNGLEQHDKDLEVPDFGFNDLTEAFVDFIRGWRDGRRRIIAGVRAARCVVTEAEAAYSGADTAHAAQLRGSAPATATSSVSGGGAAAVASASAGAAIGGAALVGASAAAPDVAGVSGFRARPLSEPALGDPGEAPAPALPIAPVPTGLGSGDTPIGPADPLPGIGPPTPGHPASPPDTSIPPSHDGAASRPPAESIPVPHDGAVQPPAAAPAMGMPAEPRVDDADLEAVAAAPDSATEGSGHGSTDIPTTSYPGRPGSASPSPPVQPEGEGEGGGGGNAAVAIAAAAAATAAGAAAVKVGQRSRKRPRGDTPESDGSG
jgi:hypothetical protein